MRDHIEHYTAIYKRYELITSDGSRKFEDVKAVSREMTRRSPCASVPHNRYLVSPCMSFLTLHLIRGVLNLMF